MGSKFHAFPGTAALSPVRVHAVRRGGRPAAEGIRRWLGLSQEAFAEVLGVSRSTVARWAAARTGPESTTAEGRWLGVLVQIKAIGETLWRDPRRARAWLATPLPVFRGRTPIEVLKRDGPMPVRDVLLAELENVYS